jgi:hypothetical protein
MVLVRLSLKARLLQYKNPLPKYFLTSLGN